MTPPMPPLAHLEALFQDLVKARKGFSYKNSKDHRYDPSKHRWVRREAPAEPTPFQPPAFDFAAHVTMTPRGPTVHGRRVVPRPGQTVEEAAAETFYSFHPDPDDTDDDTDDEPPQKPKAPEVDATGWAMQLVLAWRDFPDPTTRKALERLMLFNHMERVGTAGQTVPFNGIHHETDDDIWPDEPVVVVEPGWGIRNNGIVRTLERAKVQAP